MDEMHILKICGVDFRFRVQSKYERACEAKKLLEERFTQIVKRSEGQSKEVSLTVLALGLADELLQINNKVEAMQNGMNSILEKIKTHE